MTSLLKVNSRPSNLETTHDRDRWDDPDPRTAPVTGTVSKRTQLTTVSHRKGKATQLTVVSETAARPSDVSWTNSRS